MPPRISTIPYTPTSPGWKFVHPRPLAPILPHPSLATILAPPLPTPRPSVFHTTTNGVYHLSTHLVPAAYPRHTPDIPLPVLPAHIPGVAPSERQAKIKTLVEEALARQGAFEQGKLGAPSEKLLWNCVNRYVRTSTASTLPPAGTGITLFLAHANGSHKETWETMIRALLDAPAGEMVDEVWAWDAIQHGDSALVNAKNMNGIFDWHDNTRDIANFLLHYLPEGMGTTTLLPTRLERLPASVSKSREEFGYSARKLVVVGHSFGGCTSLRAAVDFPKLFSSFVLVDPIIRRPHTYRSEFLHWNIRTFTRRDRWSSREEAGQWLARSPFYGAWHPEVLRNYVDYALIEDGEGGVALKISPLQEGLSSVNVAPGWEMWVLMNRLDEGIPLRWVVPEKSLINKEIIDEMVWRRPANSTNVVFHFAGHFIVQEAPCELAHDISDFLLREHGCSTKARL